MTLISRETISQRQLYHAECSSIDKIPPSDRQTLPDSARQTDRQTDSELYVVFRKCRIILHYVTTLQNPDAMSKNRPKMGLCSLVSFRGHLPKFGQHVFCPTYVVWQSFDKIGSEKVCVEKKLDVKHNCRLRREGNDNEQFCRGRPLQIIRLNIRLNDITVRPQDRLMPSFNQGLAIPRIQHL